MSGKFQPIEIPAGVVSMPTKNQRSSNWAECNMIRWIEGELHPIGGQQKYNYSFATPCRAIHGWYDLQSIYHIAYVCEQNVYVDTGGTLTEITPAAGWPAPTFEGAPLSAPSPEPLATETISDYGNDAYGENNYGTGYIPVDIPVVANVPPIWSVDNFGAILLVMNSLDGNLLFWDPRSAPGTKLAKVPTSPQGRLFVVTQERFVQIFGQINDGTTDLGSFRRMGWSDQEDYTNWNFFSITGQAGYIDIEPSSPILTAIAGKYGTLFFTAKKAYVARYQGLPYVYGITELADNCSPWSPNSITTTSSYVVWMAATQGAFAFDGTSIYPIPCAVRAWITDDVDPIVVRDRAFAVHIAHYNEVWWFYPQMGQKTNTRAVIFNYKDNWWSQAQMTRSAGSTATYTLPPIMADGTVAYQHENGAIYWGCDPPWAETYDLNLALGTRMVTLKQVIPDVKGSTGDVQFSFWAQMSRSNTSPPPPTNGQGQGTPGQWTAPQSIRPDGYVDARITGRDIRMRISAPGPIIPAFTVGQHLVDFAVRGDR